MKETTRRIRRMERHHKLKKASPLNLVSLMDIFTILVFFLLVNSTSTQQLPNNKELTLPKSSAKKAPEETLIVAITKDDILVQGRKVASIDDELLNTQSSEIAGLKKELDFLYGESPVSGNGGQTGVPLGKKITIMGDENIPYELVRKILTTCQQANYTDIAFAATQIAKTVEP